MLSITLLNLRRRLRSLCADRRGNVILTFAFALIPLIAFVGTAIDYSRAASARTAMQGAIDSVALMLSKDAVLLTPTQLNEKANAYFNAIFNRPDAKDIVITTDFSSPQQGSFKLVLNGTGAIDASAFLKALVNWGIGREKIGFNVSSEAQWGIRQLELAMALDVTLSMDSSSKMTKMKEAAKSLLSTLKKAAVKDGDVKVSIVPFSVHVNADTSNVNADWLDWSDWMDEPAIVKTTKPSNWDRYGPGTDCPFKTNNHGFGCNSGPASKTSEESVVTTIPSSGTNAGLICPSKDGGGKATTATGVLSNRYYNGCYNSVEKAASDWHTVATGSSASCGSTPNCSCSGSGSSKVCKQKTYTHTWLPRPKTVWNGCVRDRNQDYDANDTAPTFASTSVQVTNLSGALETYRRANDPAVADAFQPFQYYRCPTPILPLSYDWDTLNNTIDGLTSVDATNITIGLSWALHALTPSKPLENAVAAKPDLDKVIILLTDGLNTQNRWRPFNMSGDTQVDDRTKKACDNAKAAAIKIYTIRVIEGNATLLQNCASRPDMYYDVQDANQLEGVFSTIAQNLANLRLAK